MFKAWLHRRVKQLRRWLCSIDFHGVPIGGCDVKVVQVENTRMLRYSSYWKCPHCNHRFADDYRGPYG